MSSDDVVTFQVIIDQVVAAEAEIMQLQEKAVTVRQTLEAEVEL